MALGPLSPSVEKVHPQWPLLAALVLNVFWRKLANLANCASVGRLTPDELQSLEIGLKALRDRLAAEADGDRTE